MRTIKLIKRFDFEEKNRALITLGPNVRLNPTLHKVQLLEGDDGYPVHSTGDPDLYVKTWLACPNSVKSWAAFEVSITHSYENGVQLTTDRYRLSDDGTTQYYWNSTGGTWSVATTQWSTEAEVCDHIATFPVTRRQIQVIVNLETTDARYTPLLTCIKVLYNAVIEFQEDLIFKSLAKDLQDNIRPLTDYPIKLPATTSTIDLDTYPLKTPYTLIGIDSVFDNTDDPNHLVNLFSSYNTGTKVITLTGSISANHVAWIVFSYVPEVSVAAKRTYNEIAAVPAIVISWDIVANRRGQFSDSVINKRTGAGTRVLAPDMVDIDIVLRCLTDKSRDHTRINDEIKRYFRQHPHLRSRGIDETYSAWIVDELDQQEAFEQNEVNTSRLRIRVVNAVFFNRGSEVAYAAQRFIVRGPPDLTVS